MGFREECDHCGADLHVCLNCAHHDPSAYNGCRESSAERVADSDRANRCDYFQGVPHTAGMGTEDSGGTPTAAGRQKQAMADLENLFKKD